MSHTFSKHHRGGCSASTFIRSMVPILIGHLVHLNLQISQNVLNKVAPSPEGIEDLMQRKAWSTNRSILNATPKPLQMYMQLMDPIDLSHALAMVAIEMGYGSRHGVLLYVYKVESTSLEFLITLSSGRFYLLLQLQFVSGRRILSISALFSTFSTFLFFFALLIFFHIPPSRCFTDILPYSQYWAPQIVSLKVFMRLHQQTTLGVTSLLISIVARAWMSLAKLLLGDHCQPTLKGGESTVDTTYLGGPQMSSSMPTHFSLHAPL